MLKIDAFRFARIAARIAAILGLNTPDTSRPNRPVGAALRNPMEAAALKRVRRAARRQENYDRSIRNNPCLAH